MLKTERDHRTGETGPNLTFGKNQRIIPNFYHTFLSRNIFLFLS